MTKARTRHEIIATLSSLWAVRPELRLTQLVQLVAGDKDPFYMEDGEFLRRANALMDKDMKAVCDGDMKAAIEEVARYEQH